MQGDNSSFCSRPTGMRIGGTDIEKDSGVDCDSICGSAVQNAFRPVTVDEDIFIDGHRPKTTGVYCVRKNASITRCNTSTSELIRGLDGKWSCLPLWPAIFGGADGSDILVCGGKLTVDGNAYEYRLPPASRMKPVQDPHKQVERFECTRHQYFGGPRDHMNNEYIPVDTNRFHRMRNNCAKYVANAIGIIKPVAGRSGYCNCLPTHGPLRRPADRTRAIKIHEPGSRFRSRNTLSDGVDVVGGHVATVPLDKDTIPVVNQLPYACSPCVASGDFIATDGVFNRPVRCTKANQKYFKGVRSVDNKPCGIRNFTSASQPSCVNVRVYVGENGMSYAVRRALKEF